MPPPRMFLVGVLVTIVAAGAAGAGPAVAAPPSPSPKGAPRPPAGEFRFVGGEVERRHVEAAIEQLLDEMSVFKRAFARKRLTASTRIPERVVLRPRGDEMSVTFDDRTYTSRLDRSGVEVTGPEGNPLLLRQAMTSDGRLLRVFVDKDGARTDSMRVDPGGRLTLDVRITSRRLPRPLTYRLTYARSRPPTAATAR